MFYNKLSNERTIPFRVIYLSLLLLSLLRHLLNLQKCMDKANRQYCR